MPRQASSELLPPEGEATLNCSFFFFFFFKAISDYLNAFSWKDTHTNQTNIFQTGKTPCRPLWLSPFPAHLPGALHLAAQLRPFPASHGPAPSGRLQTRTPSTVLSLHSQRGHSESIGTGRLWEAADPWMRHASLSQSKPVKTSPRFWIPVCEMSCMITVCMAK